MSCEECKKLAKENELLRRMLDLQDRMMRDMTIKWFKEKKEQQHG